MPAEERKWSLGIKWAALDAGYRYKLFDNTAWEQEAKHDNVFMALLYCYRLYPSNKIPGAVSDWLRVKRMKESGADSAWYFDTDVSVVSTMPTMETMNALGDAVMFSESNPWLAWGCIYKSANENSIPFWTRLYDRLEEHYLTRFGEVKTESEADRAVNSSSQFAVVVDECKKVNYSRLGRMPFSIIDYGCRKYSGPTHFIHHNRGQWKIK